MSSELRPHSNFGPFHLGAYDDTLVLLPTTFDTVYLHSLCSYNDYFSEETLACNPCLLEDAYSADYHGYQCYSCSEIQGLTPG